MNATTCISCGMPLRTTQDHAAGDPSKNYCLHCARPDGSMKSYDEVLVGNAAFLTRTQGLDPHVARETAKTMLAQQPAWRKH